MSAEAEITTDGGEKMGFGWSLLDIAKHATSTFISTLGDEDLLTIVTYSSAVKTVQEWVTTDEAGKKAALAVVSNMRPEVETNLGAGLKAAYEQMTKVPVRPNAVHKYNLQMLVLTDGRPTPEYHPIGSSTTTGGLGFAAACVRATSTEGLATTGEDDRRDFRPTGIPLSDAGGEFTGLFVGEPPE